MRRLLAIALVWLGCAVAWMILGATLVVRSGEVSSNLQREVHELWGAPLAQRPPTAIVSPDPDFTQEKADATASSSASAKAAKAVDLSPEASEIALRFDLEQRQKGLLWFPTYSVDFSGRYSFQNSLDQAATLIVSFPLERENALYDGFEVIGEDGQPIATRVSDGRAEWRMPIGAKQRTSYQVRYRSRGSSRFSYELAAVTNQIKDFKLTIDTDFSDVDFPAGSLSPSMHRTLEAGWHGEWRFKTLLTSAPIGVVMPEKLNPGPLASRITFFAPVGLLFFFFVVAILAAYRETPIHPLNYFMIGCAFFGFHLLFSYLVDHVSVLLSFAIAAVVSLALVVSYARLFVSWRFAWREIGISQLVYLVLFSFTFFFQGYTGLTITIGAILTLFLMMQLTGRKRWSLPDEPGEARRCVAPYRCPPAEISPPPTPVPSGL